MKTNIFSDIELKNAIDEFIGKMSGKMPFLAKISRAREILYKKGKISKSSYQHFLDNATMITYIEGVFPYLHKELLDAFVNDRKPDILVVEDLMLLLVLVEFIKDHVLEDDVDPNDFFNLHFISSCDYARDKAEERIGVNNVSDLNTKMRNNGVIDENIDTERRFIMKRFNATIGNPPYSYIDSISGGSLPNRQFWHDFTKWAFEHSKPGGLVSLITPDNWLSSDEYENLLIRTKNNLLKTGEVRFTDAKVSTRYWISIKGEYMGITDFDGVDVDMRELPYYPGDGASVSIFQKIFKMANNISLPLKMGSHNQRMKKAGGSISDTKDNVHTYPVHHSKNKIRYWSKEPVIGKESISLIPLKKVLVDQKSGFAWYDDGEKGCAENVWFMEVDDKKSADIIISYLNSKPLKFFIKATKHKVNLPSHVMNNIPMIPMDSMDHEWTDEELYEYFGLDDDEIERIEKSVK